MREPAQITTAHPTVKETARKMGLSNRDLTYLAGLLDLQWPPKGSNHGAAKKRARLAKPAPQRGRAEARRSCTDGPVARRPVSSGPQERLPQYSL